MKITCGFKDCPIYFDTEDDENERMKAHMLGSHGTYNIIATVDGDSELSETTKTKVKNVNIITSVKSAFNSKKKSKK